MTKQTGQERVRRALRNIKPDDLAIGSRRDARFELRLTRADHESIMETAQSLGMSAAEYLVALHKYAAQRLRDS